MSEGTVRKGVILQREPADPTLPFRTGTIRGGMRQLAGGFRGALVTYPPAGLPGRQELRSTGIPTQLGSGVACIQHPSSSRVSHHLSSFPPFPSFPLSLAHTTDTHGRRWLAPWPSPTSLLSWALSPGCCLERQVPVHSPMAQPYPMLLLPLGAGPDTQGPGSLPPHTPQLALISLRDPRNPESFPCSLWPPAPRPCGSLCGCSGIPDSGLAGNSPPAEFLKGPCPRSNPGSPIGHMGSAPQGWAVAG